MDRPYPRSHVTMIMGLNALSFLVGLALLVGPFVTGFYPGDIDTTVHAAVGALIATLAVFRMLLGYGSIWLDVVLIALGAITFLLPTFMHMRWNAHYNMGHMVGGGIVVAVAVISLLITIPVNNRMRHA
jgi:hypothetical protein